MNVAFEHGGARILQGPVLSMPATAGSLPMKGVLEQLPADHYHCIVTSPPYWGLRAYCKADSAEKQFELGSEPDPASYIAAQVAVFRECKRVLHPTGVLVVNIGDTYGRGKRPLSPNDAKRDQNGLQSDVCCGDSYGPGAESADGEPVGIPDMLKNALRADGWRHRDTVIWAKPAPMPGSMMGWRWEKHRIKVKSAPIPIGSTQHGHAPPSHRVTTDDPAARATWIICPGCARCLPHGGYVLRKGQWRTTTAHEVCFMFVKSDRYFADAAGVKEPAVQAGRVRSDTVGGTSWEGRDQHSEGGEFNGGATRNPRSVQTWGPEPCKFSHYAAFPSALPRFFIKAATSPKGCCPTCGIPYSPVVEKPSLPSVESSDLDRFGTGDAGVHRKVGQAYQDWRDANPDTVAGYLPSCSCPPLPSVPCRVLDPYAGTGTTLVAALELGCEADGIELNPQYVQYAIERLSAYLVPKGQAPVVVAAKGNAQ